MKTFSYIFIICGVAGLFIGILTLLISDIYKAQPFIIGSILLNSAGIILFRENKKRK